MSKKIHIEYKMHYMYDTLTINGKEVVKAEDQERVDAEDMLDYIAHALSEHITTDVDWIDDSPLSVGDGH